MRSYFWIHLFHVCCEASYFSITKGCISGGFPLHSIFTKILINNTKYVIGCCRKRSCLWWYPQIPDAGSELSMTTNGLDLSFWREKVMFSKIYFPKMNLLSPDTFLTWWLIVSSDGRTEEISFFIISFWMQNGSHFCIQAGINNSFRLLICSCFAFRIRLLCN